MSNAENQTAVATQTDKKKAPPPFILGKRPEAIPGIVVLTLPDGTESEIPVEFVYRTRKEFGEYWDAIAAAQAEAAESAKAESFSYERLMDASNRADARRVLECVRSWSLDVELSEENLVQLFDEVPGSAAAFWNTYRATIVEGRRGN